MLNRRHVITFMLLLGFAGFAHARSSVPIVNVENAAIVTASGQVPSLEAVATAIRTAGASQGYPWTASGDSAGKLVLTTIVRHKHTVVINVTFDTKTYSIHYDNSVNMNFKKKKYSEVIHPNYNVWVSQLRQAMEAEFLKL